MSTAKRKDGRAGLEPDPGEPLMAFEPGRLREADPRDLLVRFAFGAAISVIAAIVANVFGPMAGGMFLAFPAILPATLTLLEQEHGTEDAVHTDRGAVLGGIGLVAFALAAALLFERVTAGAVLAAAALAWAVVAMVTYLVVASWRRARDAR